MNNSNKRKIFYNIKLTLAILFSPIYIPHLLCYTFSKNKKMITEDVKVNLDYRCSTLIGLLYLLHNDSYFRTLFYFRIGPVLSFIINWYRPGNKYFIISNTTVIGEGVVLKHPFATIINASYIGKFFTIHQCTTIGNKMDGRNDLRPSIGDNVVLGANVNVIGEVNIANNVVIGAGSLVIKHIPENCIAGGNPCRILKNNQ